MKKKVKLRKINQNKTFNLISIIKKNLLNQTKQHILFIKEKIVE